MRPVAATVLLLVGALAASPGVGLSVARAQTTVEEIQKAAEEGTLTPEQLEAAAGLVDGSGDAAAGEAGGTLPDGTQIPGLPQVPIEPGAAGEDAAPGAGLPGLPPGISIPGLTPGAGAAADGAAPTAPGAEAGAAPVPPPYLMPGPAAAKQPISSVVPLTAPDVPLEPVRAASLIGAALAILALLGAALLRALGLRTPVVSPIPRAPRGPVGRLREGMRGTADDMRDFLRRAR